MFFHTWFVVQAQAVEMNRMKRVEIIKGISHALSYLHYDCSRPVVNQDISSNNVLLNSSFKAFVADFGAAQAVEMNQTKRVEIIKGIAHALSYLHYDCSHPIIYLDISSNNVILESSFKAFVAYFRTDKMLNLDSSNQTINVGTCRYIALGTKLEAKGNLREKNTNLKIQWANMRHREKCGAKNASMEDIMTKVQKKRFYITRLLISREHRKVKRTRNRLKTKKIDQRGKSTRPAHRSPVEPKLSSIRKKAILRV